MSSINFNDYTNYANYDSGYDFSSLMGGTANSSGNLLADYSSIKNGSYGKLVKAYYAKQDAEKAALSGDSKQKLTLMRSSADSLKKSADALNDSSLWEKKKIKKKDEETGEEIEVEDYDWDAIKKAVKSFIKDYNAVVGQAGDSDNKNVLRNAGSCADKISQKAGSLSKVAANAAAKAGTMYTNKGGYSDTLSKLFSSTVDEKIGNKDKDKDSDKKS